MKMRSSSRTRALLAVLLCAVDIGCSGSQKKENPEIGIKFVDSDGEVLELTTSFSVPIPIVKLDPVVKGKIGDRSDRSYIEVNEKKGFATLQLSGTVNDPIADIVAKGRADITKVAVYYTDFECQERKDVVKLKVNRDEPPSSFRPFPFQGKFKTKPFKMPLNIGSNSVLVEAVNFLGREGNDSTAIEVGKAEMRVEVVNGEQRLAIGSLSDVTIEPADHDRDKGLVNPILVLIKDSSVTKKNVHKMRATINRQPVGLRFVDEKLQLDRPIMGLAMEIPLWIPNLTQCDANPGSSVVTYRGVTEELSWSFTAGDP